MPSWPWLEEPRKKALRDPWPRQQGAQFHGPVHPSPHGDRHHLRHAERKSPAMTMQMVCRHAAPPIPRRPNAGDAAAARPSTSISRAPSTRVGSPAGLPECGDIGSAADKRGPPRRLVQRRIYAARSGADRRQTPYRQAGEPLPHGFLQRPRRIRTHQSRARTGVSKRSWRIPPATPAPPSPRTRQRREWRVKYSSLSPLPRGNSRRSDSTAQN